jgi:hypothetical protein
MTFQFKNKSGLIRSAADFPNDQFDYLCAAKIENDLDPEQEKDLIEIIASDKEKEKTFEIFRKTKLVPLTLVYNNKHLIKKKTAYQKAPLPAISIAAGIALLITITIFLPRNNDLHQKGNAASDLEESSRDAYIPPVNNKISQGEFNPEIQKTNNLSVKSGSFKTRKETIYSQSGYSQVAHDSPSPQSRVNASLFSVNPVPEPEGIQIEGIPDISEEKLITAEKKVVYPDLRIRSDERGRVERFLTRAYREVLLNENDDRPLNRYELAKGGVNGLNKLLGWEMSVIPGGNGNIDDTEVESFLFRSKILKFNVPVKK